VNPFNKHIMKLKLSILFLVFGLCLCGTNVMAQCAKTCTKAKTAAVEQTPKAATAVAVVAKADASTKVANKAKSCDPSNCDPKNCTPANCTPEQIAACKKRCTGKTAAKAEKAKVKIASLEE